MNVNRLTRSMDFHAQALTLRSERQRIIASNIANADTPGYVAKEMDFSAALRAATGTQASAARLDTPRPGHMGAGGSNDPTATAMRFAAPSQTNLDGNTVDMDRERASFAENAVKYEATLRFINGSVKTTLDAMKSHTQG